jgi:hypothetical protein
MAKLPVHEIRRLVLPLETAVDAALDLDSEQGGLLAFGPIVEAHIDPDPQPGLSVVVQRRGTEGTERRTFELPLLAAAFIRYCWKCRIPLPRSGTKRIEVSPEGFIFTIESTIEVVRRHAVVPKHGAPRHRDASSVPSAAAATEPAPQSEPNGEPEPAFEREPEPVQEAAQAVAS